MRLLGSGSAASRRTITTFGLAVLFAASTASAQAPAPAGQAPAQPGAQTPAPGGQAPAPGGQTPAPGGQTPAPGSAPAAAPAPAEDPFKFTSDAGGIIWSIKPEGAADFERVWGVIKTRLSASEKPDMKSLGDSLKIYKAAVPPGPEGVTYLFVADPASKTLTYQVSPFLLFESGLFERPEADELFKALQGAISRINPLPLNIVK